MTQQKVVRLFDRKLATNTQWEKCGEIKGVNRSSKGGKVFFLINIKFTLRKIHKTGENKLYIPILKSS